MIIDVSKIKDGETLDLVHEYDPAELNLEQPDLHYRDALKLNGKLERVRNSLFFKGKLTSRVEILCSRCLKPVKQAVAEPFDLYYPYTGAESIDSTDDIREVMLLSYPVKFLCQENCRGLCDQCGANLNEEKCSCAKAEPQTEKKSPFAQLGEWYKNKKKINNRGKNGESKT